MVTETAELVKYRLAMEPIAGVYDDGRRKERSVREIIRTASP
jgi:hypothetical protein